MANNTHTITITLIFKTLLWVLNHSIKGWCHKNRCWIQTTDEWVVEYTPGIKVMVEIDSCIEHASPVMYFITVECFDRVCHFTWYKSVRPKKIEERTAKVLEEISYKEIFVPCPSVEEAEEKWNMELTPFRC